MGDEEYNPLAQYDDLEAVRQSEIATKQVVSHTVLLNTRELAADASPYISEKDLSQTSSIRSFSCLIS
jgi:hypothetical protein